MAQGDIIRELGRQAIASRLKRLTDRLCRDGTRVSGEQSYLMLQCWLPVLFALIQKQPFAITTLADLIGLIHTATDHTTGQLGRRRYVSSTKGRIESNLLPFLGIALPSEATALIIWSFVD